MSEIPITEADAAPRKGDLTQGPILRTLVLFSMPALVSNLLQTLGGTINSIWVGQLLGADALAATANGNIVTFMSFAAVFGFSMATTVKVGQHFGARDLDAARRVFGTGIGFCMALSAAVSLLGWLWAEEILRALKTPESIHDAALAYLRISFIGTPIATMGMMTTMGLRGVGDARTPLYSMILISVLTALLNPVFILGWGPIPAMGIAGSAWAGLVGGTIGAGWLVAMLYTRDLPLRLRGKELRYLLMLREEIGYVAGKGLPMGASMVINTLAAAIMFNLVNREGMVTSAAYSAVLQIWNYIQMPSFAVSMAVSAMVAQSVGAGQHGRVGEVTRVGIWFNTGVTVVLSSLILVADAPLLALFLGTGHAAIAEAEHIQNLSTAAWIFTGVMMVHSGTLRAYGVVMMPLLIGIASQYFARIGFYTVFYPALGADALWLAYPFGSFLALVLTWWLYAKGGWRKGLAA